MSALLRLEEKLELPQLRRESALLGPSPENDNAIQSPLASSENSHREIFLSPHLSLLEDKSAPQVNVAEKPTGLGQRASGVGITGKEEDVEVGLQYFGKRFLNPLLGRWISADPLAVHAPGEADLNLYAYVHGTVLKSVDPLGLAEGENSSQEAAPQADATGSKGNDLVSEEGANQSYLESTTAMEATPSRAPMCWAAGCNPISGDTSERDRDQAMAQRTGQRPGDGPARSGCTVGHGDTDCVDGSRRW